MTNWPLFNASCALPRQRREKAFYEKVSRPRRRMTHMSNRRFKRNTIPVVWWMAVATASSVLAGDHEKFSTLYKFEVPDPNTLTSPLGSQPDTRPALGPGNTVYGMTLEGGTN